MTCPAPVPVNAPVLSRFPASVRSRGFGISGDVPRETVESTPRQSRTRKVGPMSEHYKQTSERPARTRQAHHALVHLGSEPKKPYRYTLIE